MSPWSSNAVALCALAAVVGVLSGPSGVAMATGAAAGVDWRQEHFDSAHSGVNPRESILSPATVAGLVPKWGADEGVDVEASPVVMDGVLYAAGSDSTDPSASVALALDAATGERLWRVRQPDAGDAPGIAVCGGRVFLATLFDHALRAYDASTGHPLWTLHADGAVDSPTLAGGVVYIQTNVGSVYAVDAATGRVVWRRTFDEFPTSSPAVYRGVVYVAGHTSRALRALNVEDGRVLWERILPDFTERSPSVVDGMVYEGVATAGIYALSARTGTVVWHRETGQGTDSTPTVDDRAAYIGDIDGVLRAFDRRTGRPLWVTRTTGQFGLNSAIEANRVIYGATDDIHAWDAPTGRELWSAPTGLVGSDPTVVHGVVYVGDFDGTLRAFHLRKS